MQNTSNENQTLYQELVKEKRAEEKHVKGTRKM